MKKIIFSLLTFIGISFALAQPAVTVNPLPAQDITWNLNNVDIRTMIEQVSRATGKNFIIDPKVSGKVSLVSSQPIPASELYHVFLSILQVHGFTAIPSGNVIKIAPIADAKQLGVPLAGKLKGNTDGVVVRVIHAHNTRADKLLNVVQPMIPSFGSVSAYLPGNDLIVMGTVEMVEHISQIVARIDNANSGEVKIIALKYIPAQDALTILDTLDKAELAKGERQVSIAADRHSNSMLIKGDPVNVKRIIDILAKLDVPSRNISNSSNVVYLRFQKAKDLAPILNKMLAGTGTEPSTPAAPTAAPALSNNISQKAFVQAEPSTNALIINAPAVDAQNILSIIRQLDIRPAQVLVEAAIVEVSDSVLNELGIDWQSINDTGLGPTSLRNPLGVNIGFIRTGSLRAIVHALASEKNINILSTPSVVVMDNHKAKIEIGKTVSIRNASIPSTVGAAGANLPYNTYSREKVGLHLHVTPQITQGDTIQMLIDQTNDSIEEDTSKDPNKDPIFNNRDINTSVMVDNRAILVLGGLISNETEMQTQKIPVLGEIPGLGNLFQYKTRLHEKKNLMVFLQPVILRDAPDNQSISEKKYEFMRQQQILQRDKPPSWLNGRDGAVLTPKKNAIALPKPFEHQSADH